MWLPRWGIDGDKCFYLVLLGHSSLEPWATREDVWGHYAIRKPSHMEGPPESSGWQSQLRFLPTVRSTVKHESLTYVTYMKMLPDAPCLSPPSLSSPIWGCSRWSTYKPSPLTTFKPLTHSVQEHECCFKPLRFGIIYYTVMDNHNSYYILNSLITCPSQYFEAFITILNLPVERLLR